MVVDIEKKNIFNNDMNSGELRDVLFNKLNLCKTQKEREEVHAEFKKFHDAAVEKEMTNPNRLASY